MRHGGAYSHIKSHIKGEVKDFWQTLGVTSLLMPLASCAIFMFAEGHKLGNLTVSAAITAGVCALIGMMICAIMTAQRLALHQLPGSNGRDAFLCTLISMPGAIALALLFGAAAYLTIGGVGDVTRHERIEFASSVATASLIWFGVVLASTSNLIGLRRIFLKSSMKGFTTITLIITLGLILTPVWAVV